MTPLRVRGRAVVAAALLLAACGGDDPEPGTVRFALTDAPACGFDEVYVAIERIRVHRSADANEHSLGWTDLRLDPVRRIDLLKLGNGVLEELGQLSLPAGRYAQLRLVLAANTGSPAANAVVPGDGEAVALDIAAAQGGIRVAHAFSVTERRTTDVLFDFDACRSVAPAGSAGYALRPVVRAVPRDGASITGYVEAPGATVSAQRNGAVVRATQADANGRFVIAFLDPAASPFDVVLTAPGRATAVVAAVPVGGSAGAELSRIDSPIGLPTATERTAGGTVGPTAARGTARVRAVQLIGSAGQVEVAATHANTGFGSYSLALPAAQPRLAAFSTRLPLSFSAAGSAGQYLLEAAAQGYAPQVQSVSVANAAATWNPSLVRQ